MWNTMKFLTASIAGTYLFVAGASCYAAEPADVETVPLGASLTTSTTGGTTITTSTGVAYLGSAPNMMDDERITVFVHDLSGSRMHPPKVGIPSYGSVLRPRGSAVSKGGE
jgi:hypothetical protein